VQGRPKIAMRTADRHKEPTVKRMLILMLGALLATVGACETDVMGPRTTAPDPALENSPDAMHRTVEHGDVYLEEYIGRYDLNGN
jgi:hypothetical protein